MKNVLLKENKDVTQTFKLTKTESKKLKARAKKEGVGVSNYIRYVLEKDLSNEA